MEHDTSNKIVTLPRVLVCGTHRGVGASTIVLGLLVAFRRQNVGVGSAKLGASLTEPTHHRRVLSRLAYSLDPWLLSYQQFGESMGRLAGGTEIGILEGSDGLFDLWSEDNCMRSSAEVAVSLGCPVILVIDADGWKESLGALVHGFASYDEATRIEGIIANRIRSDEQEKTIRAAVEAYGGPKYLGGVRLGDPHQTGGTLTGSQLYNPSALTRNRVIGTGNLIQSNVDLAAVREIAGLAPDLTLLQPLPSAGSRIAKIAVADDQAFHLTIQDNLDLIRRLGGELVAFSPIADRKLPTGTHGVYLPGGYVHLYANDLFTNKAMRVALAEFAEAGGAIYAEGAAISYLCKRITLFNGSSFEMAGVIAGSAACLIDDTQSSELLYQEVKTVERSIISEAGLRFRGFRDNRWNIRLESPIPTCFEVRDRQPLTFKDAEVENDSQEVTEEHIIIPEGFMPRPNVLATRLHLHWGARPALARSFVEAAYRFSQKSPRE